MAVSVSAFQDCRCLHSALWHFYQAVYLVSKNLGIYSFSSHKCLKGSCIQKFGLHFTSVPSFLESWPLVSQLLRQPKMLFLFLPSLLTLPRALGHHFLLEFMPVFIPAVITREKAEVLSPDFHLSSSSCFYCSGISSVSFWRFINSSFYCFCGMAIYVFPSFPLSTPSKQRFCVFLLCFSWWTLGVFWNQTCQIPSKASCPSPRSWVGKNMNIDIDLTPNPCFSVLPTHSAGQSTPVCCGSPLDVQNWAEFLDFNASLIDLKPGLLFCFSFTPLPEIHYIFGVFRAASWVTFPSFIIVDVGFGFLGCVVQLRVHLLLSGFHNIVTITSSTCSCFCIFASLRILLLLILLAEFKEGTE